MLAPAKRLRRINVAEKAAVFKKDRRRFLPPVLIKHRRIWPLRQQIVLRVSDRLEPFVGATLAWGLESHVRKPAVLCRAMPMLDAREDEHDVAGMQLPGILAPELTPAATVRAQQDLPATLVRMVDMPVVATTQLEGHVSEEDGLIANARLMTETLSIAVTANHPLAERPCVTFDDIDGVDFLLLEDIGIWHDMHRRLMPHSHFVIQKDREVFTRLAEAGTMPVFVTDIPMQRGLLPDRVRIPIDHPAATKTFYLLVREDAAPRVREIFDWIAQT